MADKPETAGTAPAAPDPASMRTAAVVIRDDAPGGYRRGEIVDGDAARDLIKSGVGRKAGPADLAIAGTFRRV